MKKLILSIVLLMSAFYASAHALWIETSAKGTKGKVHEVKIYFGEFSDSERDSVAGWFSNLEEAQLFLTDPSGNRQQVTVKDAGVYLSGTFVPAVPGVYVLSVSHTVADVYGEAKIEYYASATVVVGKEGESAIAKATALSIIPSAEEVKVQQDVELKVLFDNQPQAKTKVTIASPSGWVKTLYSDDKGQTHFAAERMGTHQLEAIRNDKTPGTHNGKPYKTVTHLVTHCIYVK